MKKIVLFYITCLFVTGASAQSVTVINGTNVWSIPTLSSTITKAGKNYEHIETSSASQTLIRVTSLLIWTVSAHMSTSNWDSSLKLSVQRTGNGTGLAILSGGTTYMQLTSSPQQFFSGALNLGGNRDNIPIQYKIEGLSVTLPVKTYTTTITYTISGI
nr:hypothetical protein [uncultured Dyadobacter sp.]